MPKLTKIIAAFPASGKSFFHKNHPDHCLDSDSSKFSWVLDDHGISTGVRNPYFPANYIEHIKAHMGSVDFIFVSSHDEVKAALKEAKLDYTLVMPTPEAKDSWVQRCIDRGNNEGFVNLIKTNWDKWTDKESICERFGVSEYISLTEDQYLSDTIGIVRTAPSATSGMYATCLTCKSHSFINGACKDCGTVVGYKQGFYRIKRVNVGVDQIGGEFVNHLTVEDDQGNWIDIDIFTGSDDNFPELEDLDSSEQVEWAHKQVGKFLRCDGITPTSNYAVEGKASIA